MRKTRLSKVLALTLVMLMVMSTAAYAAVPGTVISNTLTGTFVVAPPYNVVKEDFTAHLRDDVMGHNVGYHLENAKMSDVSSMEVSICNGDTVLMTNTANMTKFKTDLTGDNPVVSCPFAVFATFDYETDGYWTKGDWNATVSELTIPTKAIIKVTFNGDKVVTVENTNYTGKMSDIIPAELINLEWNGTTDFIKNDSGEYKVIVNETGKYNLSVTAKSDYMINKVLFIVESDTSFTAAESDGESLGGGDGYWYWGTPQGFTFNRTTVTNTFTITADPGTYNVKVYAVQLP